MTNSRAVEVALALFADARTLHLAHDVEFKPEGETIHVCVASDHGVTLHLSPVDDMAEALVAAASEASDYVTEALGAKGLVWPQCPMHPRTHPLVAEQRNETAFWMCPAAGAVVAKIGQLER